MTTHFISDLHLDPANPGITDCFLDFLANKVKEAERLYILGDLFEAWVGDDDENSLIHQVKTALRKLTDTGMPVFFMAGNRDFLIGKRFALDTGIQLLNDPHVIDLYGQKTLLMHGDTLCTDDVAYQKFRRKARNKLLQRLFLLLPLKKRQQIANSMRNTSKKHTQQVDTAIMDVNSDEVQRVIQHHQVDLLIHGHTHRPNTHSIDLNGKTAKRIVLSDWDSSGSVLIATPDQQQLFHNL